MRGCIGWQVAMASKFFALSSEALESKEAGPQ